MTQTVIDRFELEQCAEELKQWWVQDGPSQRFEKIEDEQRRLYIPYEPDTWDQQRVWERQAQERAWHAEREALERKPKSTPTGCALVTLVRSSHSDGYAYDWRYVAVPIGKSILEPFGRGWNVINRDCQCGFLDCNWYYHFKLPKGSFEFIDGHWLRRRKVLYDY